MFAVDGKANDVVNGGKGEDLCFADRGDILRGCERQFRGASIQQANSMAAAFNGGLGLVDELLAIAPTPTLPPPVVTITAVVTRTRTVTLPPCNEGPPDPPPFCGGG